jgi:membrane peptidoglycan carboxypeptidase
MGISTLRDPSAYGLSLVLGGGEVRPLEMVSAYGVFASQGKRVPVVSITRVEDSEGRTLQSNTKSSIQILDPAIAGMITDILSDNIARTPVFGAYSSLYLPGYTVAAKTGTTQEYRDAWTIGYTKELASGVWIGNNDNTEMEKAPGAVVAAPLWQYFMTKALPYLGAEQDLSTL